MRDFPLHKAPVAQEEGGGALPDTLPHDSQRTGRRASQAETARTVGGHVAEEEAALHGEVGREREAAGRGCSRGTGGEETSPTANKACAQTPRPLPHPDLAASIAQRGRAGHRPLHLPSCG